MGQNHDRFLIRTNRAHQKNSKVVDISVNKADNGIWTVIA